MVRQNIITNRPNSKGGSYFVNSEIELADDMQNERNPDTENKSNELLDRLSNIKIEARLQSSNFNRLTSADSNKIVANKYEDRFEHQLEKRII